MNLLDHIVISVDRAPYEQYGKWWVAVTGESWGRYSSNTLMFDTKEEAEAVKPGHSYLA